MRHIRTIGTVPNRAQGLCDNIVGGAQARYCFVLSFLRDVIVPLVLPFLQLKAVPSEPAE